MPVADIHPGVADLEAFTLGTLDDASLASVEAHVADCQTCQQRAAATSGDSLVELLRRVHTQTARRNDTVADAAVQGRTPGPVPADAETVGLSPAAPTDAGGAADRDVIPPELARHERYRVLRLLGAGGMGAVYEAEHCVMQRAVALKVINRAYTSRPATVERFRREVRTAARLAHSNIVTTYDAEDAGNTLFLVMEYVKGISLGQLVKERGPLPIAEACDYIRQAALGLQHAHECGMVHRDIKPDNLMLAASPVASAPGVVKVLDFGLAMLTAERGDGLTGTNVIMGTPDYMAPEQAEDARSADIRADVYSLGCTLYYVLTGSVPFPAETSLLKVLAHREQPLPPLRKVCPEMPPELAGIVARMLAKKPEDRYQTPGEVAAALVPFAAKSPLAPPKSRRRVLVGVLATLLLAGIGLTGAVVYRIQTDKGELVITSESDDVKVVITQGGKQVDVIDAKTDKQIRLNLRAGEYELELKGAPDGLKLNVDKATLTRGKETLAKIEHVQKTPVDQVGELRRFDGHTKGAWGVAFSPDGRYVLSGAGDGTVRLREVATGRVVRQFSGHNQPVEGVAFSPDGRQALTAGWDKTVRLWDVQTGNQIRVLEGHTFHVHRVAFSPDGRRALSGSGDGTMRLWDLDSGKELRRFKGGCGVAFSADGRRALSGGVGQFGAGAPVGLWDVETGAGVRELLGHGGSWVTGVVFLPGGRQALSCSHDRTLRLWDLDSGQEIRRFSGHTDIVQGVAITRDGRSAISASADKTLRVWDLQTGKELHLFTGHTEVVIGVAVSPDGRYALSGSLDGTMRLWRLPDLPPAKKKP